MDKYIARQPIFDSERVVYGYELLFRSSAENFFPGVQSDVAAASTADNLLLFGMERLLDGRRAFLNCTREFLVRDYALLLPKDRVVLEVLESIQLDDEVVRACQRFKAAGYLLALDDYVDAPEWRPLLALADIVKVDILSTPAEKQRQLARNLASPRVRLLAEKVETYDDFERTLDWGYFYFQGYFFSRPQMLSRRALPVFKLNYLRILQAANQPHVDFSDVAEMIKAETSLSYRLLRYLNSPAFSLIAEVHSIPHALSLLGERGMRRWASLVALACLGDDKPAELVTLPLVRARFCELLAVPAGLFESANDLFLLGLLSAIDGLLDMPMADVLKEIAIGGGIREALLGDSNVLREVFDVVLSYEAGAWEAMGAAAKRRRIPEEIVPGLFLQAVEWARAVFSGRDVGQTQAT